VGNRKACVYSEEFLPGRTLDKIIYETTLKHGQPSWPAVKLLFETGLAVIERLWSHKIVHRDIKPQNIMYTQLNGRDYVFFDLGIAFERDGSSLTQNTFGPGTLRYRAPETLDADYRGSIDMRCDLFSLAVTVYEFASGRHPIHEGAKSAGDTIYRLLKKNADPLAQHCPDLPSAFCSLVDRCLHKKPALRPLRFDKIRKGLEA
jgi:serine/threonine-protein kinase